MYVWSQNYNHGLIGISIALVQLDLVFYYLNLSSVETSPKKNNKKAIAFNNKLIDEFPYARDLLADR